MDPLFTLQLWQTQNQVKLKLLSSFNFSAAEKVLSPTLVTSFGTMQQRVRPPQGTAENAAVAAGLTCN